MLGGRLGERQRVEAASRYRQGSPGVYAVWLVVSGGLVPLAYSAIHWSLLLSRAVLSSRWSWPVMLGVGWWRSSQVCQAARCCWWRRCWLCQSVQPPSRRARVSGLAGPRVQPVWGVSPSLVACSLGGHPTKRRCRVDPDRRRRRPRAEGLAAGLGRSSLECWCWGAWGAGAVGVLGDPLVVAVG